MTIWIIIALVVAVLAYVRLAPSDVTRWHRSIVATEDKDMGKAAIRVRPPVPDGLARIDETIQAMPRTRILAGSAKDGHVTYITRSAAFGFPDYTTIQQDGDSLRLFARSRFGRRDFGVNSARLRQVLQGLD